MIVTFTIIKYVKKALHTVSVEINQMPKNEYANKQLNSAAQIGALSFESHLAVRKI